MRESGTGEGSMITVENLRKEYRVHERAPGLRSAMKSLFHRRYRTVSAVDGVTFSIRAGERIGFLGPNGAGKTTSLKMLSGLLYPTAGRVTVNGHIPTERHDAFLKDITLVMGQKQQLLWDLPPVDTFELNRILYDVPTPQYKETIKELESLLDLKPIMHKPTRQLSLGERMKCELTAALIHRPKVLFLDEPTIGLDVAVQEQLRDFIKRYNARYEATLLLTSHYMEDVMALCPRVIVIDQGKVTYDGGIEALVKLVRPEKRILVRLRQAPSSAAALQLQALGRLVELHDTHLIMEATQDVLGSLITRAFSTLDVRDIDVESAPLNVVMSELFRLKSVPKVPGGQAS
jgi:ABC-2 type transport system ATP-binding protein